MDCAHAVQVNKFHFDHPSCHSPPPPHTHTGCCIYSKPHKFGESDTESDSDGGDDDCCHEHRVARRRVPHKQSQPQDQPSEKSS